MCVVLFINLELEYTEAILFDKHVNHKHSINKTV